VYYNAAKFINNHNCSDIGLITGTFGLEYPFWAILQEIRHTRIRIEHVNVTNVSAVKSTINPFADFSPCAIIAVDAEYYTAPTPEESVYTKALSSGPVRVFTRRQDLQGSR
jgi:hypothetical protein